MMVADPSPSRLAAVILIVAMGLPAASSNGQDAEARLALPVSACFSPAGGCTEAVVAALGKAESALFVQARSFTSAPIAEALVDARKHGVKAQVILDKPLSIEEHSSADAVAYAGIPNMAVSSAAG